MSKLQNAHSHGTTVTSKSCLELQAFSLRCLPGLYSIPSNIKHLIPLISRNTLTSYSTDAVDFMQTPQSELRVLGTGKTSEFKSLALNSFSAFNTSWIQPVDGSLGVNPVAALYSSRTRQDTDPLVIPDSSGIQFQSICDVTYKESFHTVIINLPPGSKVKKRSVEMMDKIMDCNIQYCSSKQKSPLKEEVEICIDSIC